MCFVRSPRIRPPNRNSEKAETLKTQIQGAKRLQPMELRGPCIRQVDDNSERAETHTTHIQEALRLQPMEQCSDVTFK